MTQYKALLLAWVENASRRPDVVQDPEFAALIGETLLALSEPDKPLPNVDLKDYPDVIPLSARRG